jgi:hypothetical protein
MGPQARPRQRAALTAARPDRRRVLGRLHPVASRSVLARSAHYKQVGPDAIVGHRRPPAAPPGQSLRAAPRAAAEDPRPGNPQEAKQVQQQRYRFVFPGAQVTQQQPEQQRAEEQEDDGQRVGGTAACIAGGASSPSWPPLGPP